MENNKINFSVRPLITKFKHVRSEGANPDVLWRAVLWATLFFVSAIALFAYYTYDWAINAETPLPSSKSARTSFSLAELEEVIASYHRKEVNFSALKRNVPSAPDYRRSGGQAASTTIEAEAESEPPSPPRLGT